MRLTLGLVKCLLCIAASALTTAALRYVNTPYMALYIQASWLGKYVSLIAPVVGGLAVTILLIASGAQRKEVERLKRHYADISPDSGEALTQPRIAAAQESRLDDFNAMMASLSGASAYSDMPTIATLARMAGDGASAQGHIRLSELIGDSDASVIVEKMRSSSTFTMSVLAQLTAMSDQYVKVNVHDSPSLSNPAPAGPSPAGRSAAVQAPAPSEIRGAQAGTEAKGDQRAPVGATTVNIAQTQGLACELA